jgi:hypothetical protein
MYIIIYNNNINDALTYVSATSKYILVYYREVFPPIIQDVITRVWIHGGQASSPLSSKTKSSKIIGA